MKLYEDEAKSIFKRYNIEVPKQIGIITSLEEAKAFQCEFPIVLKALVLIGGRGKAGGIRKVNNKQELLTITKELLDLKIDNYPVKRLFL